jgi:hypothetical protein
LQRFLEKGRSTSLLLFSEPLAEKSRELALIPFGFAAIGMRVRELCISALV